MLDKKISNSIFVELVMWILFNSSSDLLLDAFDIFYIHYHLKNYSFISYYFNNFEMFDEFFFCLQSMGTIFLIFLLVSSLWIIVHLISDEEV